MRSSVTAKSTNRSEFHGVNSPRYEQILNAANPLFNPTSANFIGQTVMHRNQRSIAAAVAIATGNAHCCELRGGASDITGTSFERPNWRHIGLKYLYHQDIFLFDCPQGAALEAHSRRSAVVSREAYSIDPDDQNRLQHGRQGVRQRIVPVNAGSAKMWAGYAESAHSNFQPRA